jgi:hypothetical protein
MNEIFVAKNALAADLTSSAVGRSTSMTGIPAATWSAFSGKHTAAASPVATPASRP